MKRILLLIILLTSISFANIEAKIAKNIGLDESYLQSNSFKLAYKEFSRPKIISYYNGLLRKSALNMQITRELIENKKLPDELFFIPLIESSYKNQINGKNSPRGLWQIMPQTGRNLKLTVNESVDERLDLLKSTNAAGTYLKKYYKIFNKWYLAIMAYNSGEGRVISGLARASLDRYLEINPSEQNSAAVKQYKSYINEYTKTKKGIKNLYIVYERYAKYYDYSYAVKNNHKDYFPKTTINYINKILVFSILNEQNKFSAIDKKSKYNLEAVDAPKGKSLKAIANAIAINSSEFININKHIKKDIVPSNVNNLKLNIPHTKLDVYNQKIANIKINNQVNIKNDRINNIYVVKAGDTLSQIASKHNVSTKKLRIIKRKKPNIISVGDEIEIIK